MSDHPGGEVRLYADEAMYTAEGMDKVNRTAEGDILPTVHLLWMTPDPLGAVAAMGLMYKGTVVRNLADITDEQRLEIWEAMQHTHLPAPLEAIQLHFMIEGVTRSLTHQMVRQRTAVYAQESLRFAVKDEQWADVVSRPPSVAEGSDFVQEVWARGVGNAEVAYKKLIELGVPAEDARGLMPHAMTTRLNYNTNLRNLIAHAGNRLCTQAQFEWRAVFSGIIEAIGHYPATAPVGTGEADEWQCRTIAESSLFRPACYQVGHCPFQASFDRFCVIRERVDDFARNGVPSVEWDDRNKYGRRAIHVGEWLMDPAAARVGPATDG